MKRYVAIAVIAGAFAVAVGSGAAAPPAEVELVWGSGAAPAFAAAPAHPASTRKHGSTVELHWGNGGAPQYVTVTAN